jgi:hypothetical protein
LDGNPSRFGQLTMALYYQILVAERTAANLSIARAEGRPTRRAAQDLRAAKREAARTLEALALEHRRW